MKSLNFLILLFFIIQLYTNDVYSIKDPSCGGASDPCVLANQTLVPCKGIVRPPPPGATSGEYNVLAPSLFNCACNMPFYNLMTKCTTCFEGPGTNITMEPLAKFETTCGAKFSLTAPPPGPPAPGAPAPAGTPVPPVPAPGGPLATSATGPPAPKSTRIQPPPGFIPPTPSSCISACLPANSSLVPCKGIMRPPSKSLIDGTSSGYYDQDFIFARCECNMKYYNSLKDCVSCFSTPYNNITVQPLDDFIKSCTKSGVKFGESSSGPSEPSPSGKIFSNDGISLIHYSMKLGNSITILLSLLIHFGLIS